jgi:DNA-binding NarL/FixJ family response regulator/class 3 adenylate cyclase
MPDLPGGTVTFLFTDIEGSTRLLKQLQDRYAEAMADHQHLLRVVFEENGGREIDTQGDAFFVVFRRAKDAVTAAVAAQRALAAHAWPAKSQLRVRMGMHTGEPTVTPERYVGLGVHRTARICAAGHGGQILASHSTYAVLVDDELPGITFRDLGEHRLKDLEHPERIYQVSAFGLPDEFPSLRTLGREQSEQIPFRGREQELAEVVAGSSLGATRVVVADDSVLLREGLSRLLEEAGFAVVARVGNAEELLGQVRALRPDVAIVDIRMPPTHTDEGLVAAEEIRRSQPEVGVLVLSQYLASAYAMRLLERYPEKVGYLLKERVSDVAVLADAIRRIAEGECVLDPTIVARLMNRSRGEGPLDQLTDREREVVALIAEGHSNETIGEKLNENSSAVEAEVKRIFSKLNLADAEDLRRILSVLSFLRS